MRQRAEQLWSAYRVQHGRRLREQLIEHYRPLAMKVLQQLWRRPDEDMEQVALIGLMKAVDRFDPSRGCGFASFAVPTIQGELKRYLRDQTRLVRCPRSLLDLHSAVNREEGKLARQLGRSPTLAEISAALGVELDDVVEAMALEETCHPASLDSPLALQEGEQPLTLEDCMGGSDPELDRVDDQVAMRQVVEGLEQPLRSVIKLRYFQSLSQQEAARRLGVSQMQVSRLERRALNNLRSEVATA
jgi:RNA polymerase sigma-B factor